MRRFREGVIGFYTLAILGVLPLFFWNDYDDILWAKTLCFWITAAISLVLLLVPFCHWLFTDRKKGSEIRRFCHGIDILDIAVAAFGIFSILASVFSEWKVDAWTGRTGWYVGGAMLAMVCLFYFLVSRGRKSDQRYTFVLIGAAFLVMLFGILNDFWLDPLSMTERVNIYWRDTFTSTIGNVNQFAAYLSILVPFISMFFVCETQPFYKTIAAIVLFPCYLNLFLTHADGIYIGVGIGMLAVLLYSLQSPARYLSFLLNGVWFGVAGWVTTILLQLFPKIAMDDVSPILLGHHAHFIVGGASFALILLHMFVELKADEKKIARFLRVMSFILLCVLLLAFVTVVVWLIVNFNPMILNRRGTIWTIALEVYADGEWKDKLIGLGPCCLDHNAVDYAYEIVESYGAYYTLENAHNDVIEYLVTTGALGCASYVLIFGTVGVRFLKNLFHPQKASDETTFLSVALIGYAAQALLYGPHPLTTAICFLLLAIYRNTMLER